MEDMAAIAARLAELREADTGRSVFGSSTHGHTTGGPVDPALLARVEELAGVRLPEHYRAFLTTVGDGGAGPYYGITPLADALAWITDGWGAEVLGADSPLTGDVDFTELLDGPEDWEEHAALLESDPEYEAGFERLKEEYLGEPWCNGRLPIAEYGCGDWYFLVLRGPRRGSLWVDCVVGGSGMYCLEVDFGTWYSRWLDDTLDRVGRDDFAPENAVYSVLRHGDNPRYRVVPPQED
ncbi:SMI1/KNR4 family protein [Phytomonospora endophytica]|uniref:Knr4/Smi1-like domain-containing protein n=1 Tax=Phytomonospora endophytica TaxID=714109 RepID=A0A841FHP9_9ACTN|nr:SMI1/KNR4 family protein [Phytomonospora endophytica]MBB6036871.1 hypothetical protein [Phytomonospora endophytica]GIG68095.1 hypothetical protein Pen01_43900 [Phytomonospora endophytica]